MRILITGATGVVGQEVIRSFRQVASDADVICVSRRPAEPTAITWTMGAEPAPAALRGHWDVVVHTAASTRWSMSREEAQAANLQPMNAVLDLLDADTHLVHLSTAYVEGADEQVASSEFGKFRNGYEWSKAACEELARERHRGPLTIVRPPLIIGSSVDGSIARFTGPYTLLQALVSGLAAAVVGEEAGYAELAPVDEVAAVTVAAALGDPPPTPRVEIIAGGPTCLQLGQLLHILCDTVNEWRAGRNLAPVSAPPFIATHRWHRFFLPLAEQHLSPVQLEVVRLLGMFESYTSLAKPLPFTVQVKDPAAALVKSVRWWADRKPRHAGRTPQQWQLIG